MDPTEFISDLRKGRHAPIYFLRGPDRFLHEECRRALINSVPPHLREWCLADMEFQPGGFARQLEGANQMPMLGGHNFLVFSDPEDFRHATDDDVEALEAYAERPSPFSTVAFAAVDPDRRRRFIQLLEKNVEVVEMRPLGRRQAAAWARDFLHDAGANIDLELAGEIAAKFEITNDRDPERAGVNLLWMRTELEKLLTSRPGIKRLEPADLNSIVAFREEHEVGKLLRAVAERKVPEALEHLRALLATKTAETLLLWCFADLFRQALKLEAASSGRQGRGEGLAPERASWSRSRGAFSTMETAAVALRNYRSEELLGALRLARRTDLGIKSSWKDSKILLEYLVWQVAVGNGPEGLPEIQADVPVTDTG